MAVDTAQKRFSMMGLGSPIPSMVSVPTGSVAAAMRADLVYLYSGITLQLQALQAVVSTFYTLAYGPAHYVDGRGPAHYTGTLT